MQKRSNYNGCLRRPHTHTTRSNINIKINTYECCSYHHLVWWKTHEAMLVCSFQVYWKVCSQPNGAAVAVAVGRERYGTKERDVDRENEKQKIVLHLCHALFNTQRIFSPRSFMSTLSLLAYSTSWKNDNGTMITLCFGKYTKSSVFKFHRIIIIIVIIISSNRSGSGSRSITNSRFCLFVRFLQKDTTTKCNMNGKKPFTQSSISMTSMIIYDLFSVRSQFIRVATIVYNIHACMHTIA